MRKHSKAWKKTCARHNSSTKTCSNNLRASQITILLNYRHQRDRVLPSYHLQFVIILHSQIKQTENRHSNRTFTQRRTQNNHNPLKSIKIVCTMNHLTTPPPTNTINCTSTIICPSLSNTPKTDFTSNSHAETPTVLLKQLEICTDVCANHDLTSETRFELLGVLITISVLRAEM